MDWVNKASLFVQCQLIILWLFVRCTECHVGATTCLLIRSRAHCISRSHCRHEVLLLWPVSECVCISVRWCVIMPPALCYDPSVHLSVSAFDIPACCMFILLCTTPWHVTDLRVLCQIYWINKRLIICWVVHKKLNSVTQLSTSAF